MADPNLLELIVRESAVGDEDVVLEIGGGAGVLTERLAELASHVHVIEVDERLRPELEAIAGEHPNVGVTWGDALRVDLRALDPVPSMLVSNLPYSIATPLLLRTVDELPDLKSWTVIVQREIAERLQAAPGSRLYGAPSVLIQLACDVELLRTVNRAVFVPRPRVDSALLRMRRRASAPSAGVRRLVHAAFAHRRKSLARSLELSAASAGGGPGRAEARFALREARLPENARAEALAPADFVELERRLAAAAGSTGSREGRGR
jgi:16S rRNA (adenine1518-N6/adenine1519-N6)-dimethyltransferase